MIFPKISVVTPSFNQGQFLEETILSVLNQDYPNLEYIIIDGGSTDGSVDIIKRYQHRLSYWISEKDNGFADAINKGFKKASGEIFCWLNSDDLLFQQTLNVVGKFFLRYPHVDMVFGDRHIIDEYSNLIAKQRYYFYTELLFRYGKSIPQECTFWRRDLYRLVGGLDESLNYAIDLDLWCKFAKRGQIRHIPFYLGKFRRHKDAKSSTIFQKGRVEATGIVTKYYGKYPSNRVRKVFKAVIGILRRGYRLLMLYALKRYFYKRSLGI